MTVISPKKLGLSQLIITDCRTISRFLKIDPGDKDWKVSYAELSATVDVCGLKQLTSVLYLGQNIN